ncbi:MAG: zinc ribbon domain-containing protein [Pyrinomonadaceae bacterium]|nr:zinc ribbon domain-containing protein [Pyrinomonadaceae bacterium]
MFCPQCGHQQISNNTHFCSRCGLPLRLVTDLLANSSYQLQREKMEITGIGLTMATVLMLVNFIIVFGAVTLPHLSNPVFLWIWLSFVISSLVIGGFGLANLIRGGFFKRLKERESRLNLMRFEQQAQTLPEASKGVRFDPEPMARSNDPISITETTTRELQLTPKANKQDVP